MTDSVIDNLVSSQRPGHGLQQGFYRDASVYRQEFERIFSRSWVYAGHTSQVPATGDFFLFDFAGESVIVVRSAPDRIQALINVCRHRGSRVCLESQGNASRFVCPYHAWTYAIDGNLLAAPQLGPDFDLAAHGLKQAQIVDFHGMLFVNFDAQADFAGIEQDLDECLQPFDLAGCRVASQQSYPIHANWKLAVENYCECYHCVPAHREFAVGHGRARPEEKVEELRQAILEKGAECGLSTRLVDASWYPTIPVGCERYFDRYPMIKGQVTGSRTGRPVAPLLGTLQGYDGGASEFQIGPFSYGLVYADHAVLYRFVPIDAHNTGCDLVWLVRDTAVEGTDYELEELTWLWDVTTVADKRIIEDNRRGVDSRFFEPGPFAPMEYFTQRFVEWYLRVLEA